MSKRRTSGLTKPRRGPVARSDRRIAAPAERLQFAIRTIGTFSYMETRTRIMRRFGVSIATAERDIAAARAAIDSSNPQDAALVQRRVSDGLLRVARRAERDGKWSAASASWERLARVNGLLRPDGPDIDHAAIAAVAAAAASATSALTTTAKRSRLEELQQKAAARAAPSSAVRTPAQPDDDGADEEADA